ncbi:hypothetical protein [Microlunatus elymi]|uniref:hypothetical protein n=1 Tax=Microlunatus elymi TaxID=2596828 RepID=UPI001AF02560|nr:hypothetical protein [Microlunatus elymi]
MRSGAMGRVRRAAYELIVWFAAGVLTWIVTLSSASPAELVAGAGAAALVAVLARAARRAMGLAWRPVADWLRWVALVPMAAALDVGRVLGWLIDSLRHGRPDVDPSQRLVRRRLLSGEDAATVARRVGGVLAVSATPGAIAVDQDPGTRTVLLHQLVGGWPDLDRRATES